MQHKDIAREVHKHIEFFQEKWPEFCDLVEQRAENLLARFKKPKLTMCPNKTEKSK